MKSVFDPPALTGNLEPLLGAKLVVRATRNEVDPLALARPGLSAHRGDLLGMRKADLFTRCPATDQAPEFLTPVIGSSAARFILRGENPPKRGASTRGWPHAVGVGSF